MQYRKLGRYGIKVSVVSVGGWLTHGRSVQDSTTEKIIKRSLELGVNFFDTADAYNAGEAEISLGKALNGVPREEVVIGTKCFFPITENVNDRGLSRKHITESVNKSLRRLGTDYIDMMQFHRFDENTPVDETVRAIEDLIRQGKVLYWGVSEWTADQISNAVSIAKELNTNPPASNQPVYNMLNRGIEDSVIPTCARHGLGLVVFSPLAQGILTGKYLPGQPAPEGSRGSDDTSNQFMKNLMTDETLTKVQNLKKFVEERGFTLPQFALAWCLRQPVVSSVIIGATRPEQVEANVLASEAKVEEGTWAQAEEILK